MGRLFGAILLIAGSCMGAGMLGLPVLTAVAGFIPSMVILALCWLLMVAAGLLLIEINLWFAEDVNIPTMAGRTLGKWGKIFGGGLFGFHLFALTVAYFAGAGQLLSEFFLEITHFHVSETISQFIVLLIFGMFFYLGMESVDYVNRFLIVGFFVTYTLLVTMGWKHVIFSRLSQGNWGAVVYSIPTMVVCFGYHNIIPSLASYLERDVKRLRIAVIAGSALPLLLYFLWEALVLGLIPLDEKIVDPFDRGALVTFVLRYVIGSHWITVVAEYFAFFALTTSFLSIGVSLIDFLADGLSVPKDRRGKVLLCFLALVPPFIAGCFLQKNFLVAMNFAGAFGSLILFGVFTVAMAWAGRYQRRFESSTLLPGGKIILTTLALASLGVVLLEYFHT